MNKKFKRFWEIDFLRGIAIILMIIYHVFFDLNFFNVYRIDMGSGFWLFFPYFIAGMFIFLVGVSLTLSYSKAMKQKKSNFPKYLKRGLKIFSWGLIITFMTWFFLRNGTVIFGILHLIGLSIILAYPFLKFRLRNLLFGIVFIIVGIYLYNFVFSSTWFVWIGLKPSNLYTVDYFPVFPWFGVVLIGIFFGNLLYTNYRRKFNLKDISNFIFVKLFCFLGRHSLFIYLIHQPILILILYLLGVDIGFL